MYIPNRLTTIVSVLIGACVLALLLGGPVISSAAATDRTVLTGGGAPGYSVNAFALGLFTVATGSTVTFTNPWFEPHTVTFLDGKPLPAPSDPNAPVPTNPGAAVSTHDGTSFLNSGFLFKGDSFKVTLTKAGSYQFFCIIHPGMQGSVVVDNDDTKATSQAAMDAAGQAVINQGLALLKDQAAKLAALPIPQAKNADGSTTWSVTAGGLVGTSDLQQFFPPSLNVRLGDTVSWASSIPTPHTITFLGGTAFPVPPSPGNPKVLMPAPPPPAGYDGNGYVNSGVIGIGWPAGQTFSVKFSKAGTDPYLCVLHADQGMGGVVNVSAATGVIPAATGNAGLTTSNDHSLAIQLVALGAALLIVIGAAFAVRRYRR